LNHLEVLAVPACSEVNPSEIHMRDRGWRRPSVKRIWAYVDRMVEPEDRKWTVVHHRDCVGVATVISVNDNRTIHRLNPEIGSVARYHYAGREVQADIVASTLRDHKVVQELAV